MKIVAHRGDIESCPENTLIAFMEAIKKGANAIEMDVHLSLDSKLIVHHDYDLKNPSKGKGFIHDTSSVYIKTLDAGVWFSQKFAKEKIPFLEEVFETLGKSTYYEIELKGYTKEFLDIVFSTVKKFNLFENIEFTSPHIYMLTYIKKLYPGSTTGMFVWPIPDWMDKDLGREIIKNNALFGDINVLHFPLSILTEKYIDSLHYYKFIVHAANCNTEIDIKKAYKLKVDQFSTNMLNLALAIKKNYE